jgi:arginyl-tRNA synthetase
VIDIPEGPGVSRARAANYECARQVLNNGPHLLGITPVERYVQRTEYFDRADMY